MPPESKSSVHCFHPMLPRTLPSSARLFCGISSGFFFPTPLSFGRESGPRNYRRARIGSTAWVAGKNGPRIATWYDLATTALPPTTRVEDGTLSQGTWVAADLT
ncbi:hypothetical protein ACA910_019871 [Epithemia clementina (nom. ined.)]